MNKIELTKNKFEILSYDKGDYRIREDEKKSEDFIAFNYFGEVIHLYGYEIVELNEYLMKNRGK